jgi:hypothetical protein
MATHRLHGRDDIGAELRVPINDQEALRLLAAFSSFVHPQLDPKSVGIESHVMVKDSTTVVADHEEEGERARQC